ncbi:MAG TPA: ankyrin repeat domain-containing protein [Bryobacteraceae bacterium]|nr:ankyrin repeat domain-containing protein [Bryobacteraceae bacterium]
MHREVKCGNTVRVRELLRDGAELNVTDRAGCTPLMYALESPAAPVELVQLLLERGGAIAETDRFEGTINITSVCLRGGDPLKLDLVLERGADIHYTRSAGYDALMDAAFSRNADHDPRLLGVLKILIARGASLNGVGSYQESALRVLSRLGRFDAVKLLLAAGADENQLAWTPLHRAVALGTLVDVKALVGDGEYLESVDWWERTPWLVAIKTGDLEKARYLFECGADFTVAGKGGVSPLDLAIESFHTPMLKWLIALGISVESSADCCISPLMNAVQADNAEAVDVLIAAGAHVDRQTACGSALGCVHSREIGLRLLDAGADPAHLSFAGRRAILGLEPQPDELLFDATPEDFRIAPSARWGDHNPELMNQPFWQAMIRSGITAYSGAQLVGGTRDDCPVWCAQRFGQSLTLLPDGRAIQIGGEHEDSYDSDFCIYNDVFVHHPDGRIDIFCYPEDVFPPTDFHTATLIGDSIYILGGLGYKGSRSFGETPVFFLDIHTLQIRRVKTSGGAPGWISRHRAVLVSPHEIRVWGGKIAAEVGETETYDDNHRASVFDVTRRQWRREA